MVKSSVKVYIRYKMAAGYRAEDALTDDDFEYIVYSATNTTNPRVSQTLTRAQVDELIQRGVVVTITRKPAEKR